jgi:Leucine-rich repeat (LRR) protein
VRQQPEYATITGSALEIEAIWSQVELSTLLTLNFVNVPRLSMPPTLHNFHALIRLTIQNGSLAEWNVNAALTNTHHPTMHSLALVAVALPFDERDPRKAPILPPALVASTDFPTKLLEIRIEACNLTRVPVDLDMKWPRYASLNLRNNALESVPDVFHRLTPVNLLLQSNHITQVPKSLFAWPALAVLDLSRNPITSIIESASKDDTRDFAVTDSLRIVSLSRSLLVNLPEWLVTSEVLSRTLVLAADTPLCQDVLAKKRTPTFDTARVMCVA